MEMSPWATQLTRTWDDGPAKRSRSMQNNKPYRTKANKELAKKTAKKGADGAFHSSVPTNRHSLSKGK